MSTLPAAVDVVIEVPRGGFVKRTVGGGVDYISPLPSPFNYGVVPDSTSPDGDGLDVVVLGPRLPAGHRGRWPVLGVVRFVDDGDVDDKLVCGSGPLRRRDELLLISFFKSYALGKTALGRGARFGGFERR